MSSNATPESAGVFDYVVVGGGSSGCALAARLCEDGRHTVAVLEAGRRQWPKTTAIPAALVKTIGDARYDWQYVCEPDPTRANRQEAWPRGRGPGGSGLINGMIFVRGAPQDYDAWEALGARGWGWRDVMPSMRRIESIHGIDADGTRGRDGPQHVSALQYVHPSTRLFVSAAVRAGIPFTRDYNGPEQEGVGFVQAAQLNGRRCSPFDAFLAPAVARGAVTLIEDAQATRVLFHGRKATGVELRGEGTAPRVVQARRCVVLSAGAIDSPALLMRSGIGDARALSALGIEVVTDSPEVGRNLMEHAGAWMRARLDIPTLNQVATPAGRMLAIAKWLGGRGPATTSTAQSVAFVRTQPDIPEPDIQIHFAAFGFTGPAQTDPAERLVMIVPSVNHPESRGEIALASADIAVPPRIRPRLLDSANDLATLRRGVRVCEAILGAEPLSRHVVERLERPPLDAGDATLDDWLRQATGPLYHPVGTCRMGSDDSSVVDPELHVRGVTGLAVADASIMPRHISGNTHAAALMIGDRAGDILRKEA